MRTLYFAWHYLWARPLAAVLNVLLLSLGLASITFLILVGYQVDKAFERDLAGIDVVVGAEGSPMQLILSGVLHVDVPPGNIRLAAVEALAQNPLVEQVIPISLGDTLEGYRIVGTTPAYATHYGVTLASGRMWDAPMQAVVGSRVARALGLGLGSTFASTHGLAGAGQAHADARYTVVGVLAPSGSVLDRLVLTDTASVWHVHDEHRAESAHDEDGHEHEHAHKATPVQQGSREVTVALIRYRTPLAAMSFPRWVNTTTDMQAAAPAVEISRLLHMLGLGTDVLRGFATVLLLTAALSVFIALFSAVRERRTDMAVLRMLGTPAGKVAALLLLESLWLGLMATALGLALGQGGVALLGWGLGLDQSLLTAGVVWPLALCWVPALAFLVSVGAALLPAWSAYRVSVLELLQSG